MPTCIRCGRNVETLVDGRLCPDCFLELYGLGEPPPRLQLTVCPRCGSFRYEGRWLPPPGGGLEEVAALLFQARFKPAEPVEYYRVESVELDTDEGYALVEVAGRLRGVEGEARARYRVPLQLSWRVCPLCLRKASGAPEAIVQIRGPNGRLDPVDREAVEEILSSLDEGVAEAVISVDEVREGIDVKMADKHAARALAARLRSTLAARVRESHKLITQRRDGRKVTRLTLSVRLPFFTEGSLVEYEGKPARVEEIRGGYVYVRPLGSTRSRRLRVEEAWKRLGELEPERDEEALVAAVEPGWLHLQQLGGSYSYLELRRSEVTVDREKGEGEEPRPGERVRLIEHRGRYYIV